MGTQARPGVIYKTPGVTVAYLSVTGINYVPPWELDASMAMCLYQGQSILSKESRQLFLAGPRLELEVSSGRCFSEFYAN